QRLSDGGAAVLGAGAVPGARRGRGGGGRGRGRGARRRARGPRRRARGGPGLSGARPPRRSRPPRRRRRPGAAAGGRAGRLHPSDRQPRAHRRARRRARNGGTMTWTANPALTTAAGLPPLQVLPARLGAPRAGWTRQADVVVIGSGVAGLTAALRVRAQLPASRVLLVTKALLDMGSTRWAQGGIASALAAEDSPDDHLRDTLVAGVGLCDPAAVRVLVTDGPARVRELATLGAEFDRTPAGELSLTREGGHLRDRIVHAGGDATGLEVERALIAALRADASVEVIEHALVLDLLVDADGRAAGTTLHVLAERTRDVAGAVLARAVILATGGMGQIYASTTNPSVSTGDGVALALRAGAVVTDLEFVQFHPTALKIPGVLAAGQQPLVSEAMRGEGA